MPEVMAATTKSLRDRRIEAGLTLKQVAAELGACESSVSQWETGQAKMRPKNVPLLATLFGCTPAEIRESASRPHRRG